MLANNAKASESRQKLSRPHHAIVLKMTLVQQLPRCSFNDLLSAACVRLLFVTAKRVPFDFLPAPSRWRHCVDLRLDCCASISFFSFTAFKSKRMPMTSYRSIALMTQDFLRQNSRDLRLSKLVMDWLPYQLLERI